MPAPVDSLTSPTLKHLRERWWNDEFTHFLAERLRANPLISGTLEKLAGLFLIGFGIKLVISR